MGLLVLIHKEKYFKEHLIRVQGAWLLKMSNSVNVCESVWGREEIPPCSRSGCASLGEAGAELCR